MGFFHKSTHAQRRLVSTPGVAVSQGGRNNAVASSESATLPTEQIRASLANLFVSDEDENRDANLSEFVQKDSASCTSPANDSTEVDRTRSYSPRSPNNLPSRSKSTVCKWMQSRSASGGAVRPLASLSTSIEHVGSSLEELTPLSVMAPVQFPDAGKSPSTATAVGHNESSKWPHQGSRAVSPRMRSFQTTSSSQSPGARKSLGSRTNSLSRFARRASAKRKSSSKYSSSDFGAKAATLEPPSPGPGHEDALLSLRKASREPEQSSVGVSASPMTPHDDALEPQAVRETAGAIPVFASPDDLMQSPAKATRKQEHVNRQQSRNATESGQEVESARRRTGTVSRPSAAPQAVSVEEGGVAETAVKEHHSNLVAPGCADNGLSPRMNGAGGLTSGDWGSLDADDFVDVYGLEAATARDFAPAVASSEKLHNSPTSPGVSGMPFSKGGEGHSSSDSGPNSLMAPAEPRHVDAPVPASSESEKPNLFGASPQSKPKANGKGKVRKRPPPLLTPEPPSGTSSSSYGSPSTGVFASNGDFTTGGFRITSEGMVGKPDRVTRRDSDDAPSMGFVPATLHDLLMVRGLQEFRKGPTLGMGAAGRVYLAIHEPSGKSMAIKVVNVYDEAKRNQLLKELDTLSSHVSRFLVRFYGAFYDGKGAVHIALEFMDGGCLSSTVHKFGAIPEPVTKMIAVDCLRALRFLHRHNVLHRDFKTANILLSRKSLCAKVSDFGLARDLDAGVSKVDTFVGTIAYMSPERLHGGKYTYASDIWALGISIVECILGRYPFDKPQSYFDYLDVKASDMLNGVRVSLDLKDFVRLCTQSDPLRRPTAAQLMQHPWLAGLKRDPEMMRLWMDTLQRPSTDAASTKSVLSIRSFLNENSKSR